jgi:hypothetical protein
MLDDSRPKVSESMTNETKPAYEKTKEDPAHREERIRERAYQMWEADGRPEGNADQYWHRAKELIEDEDKSAYPPSASRGNRS